MMPAMWTILAQSVALLTRLGVIDLPRLLLGTLAALLFWGLIGALAAGGVLWALGHTEWFGPRTWWDVLTVLLCALAAGTFGAVRGFRLAAEAVVVGNPQLTAVSEQLADLLGPTVLRRLPAITVSPEAIEAFLSGTKALPLELLQRPSPGAVMQVGRDVVAAVADKVPMGRWFTAATWITRVGDLRLGDLVGDLTAGAKDGPGGAMVDYPAARSAIAEAARRQLWGFFGGPLELFEWIAAAVWGGLLLLGGLLIHG